MPAADLATIIANLPPLAFFPAAEAPVSNTRQYVVAPGDNDDWVIARHLEEGWADAECVMFVEPPLLCAALPPAPFRHQYALKDMATELAEHIDGGRLNEAARLIDQLADEVRRLRESPLAGVAGGAR